MNTCMEQPPGCEEAEGMVCKLNGLIYGLRTSPEDWNSVFDDLLKQLGFTRSKSDLCV